MKNVKLIFQGDSITDAGRDRRNYHDLGLGYPKYAAEHMVDCLPDVNFDFTTLALAETVQTIFLTAFTLTVLLLTLM